MSSYGIEEKARASSGVSGGSPCVPAAASSMRISTLGGTFSDNPDLLTPR